ncbi:MAG: DUF3014 domain-containing protein [Lentisphaerae bacterium]|jgi:hypothetical protein|nr:DUF3014 domain-containing protein [Lentisphaerota bacterium]MBT4821127.1 DUF3014 domain-containing protein [Lentisphaerota bacterium]MBT5608752.1 DUF3014 domain-containing protein [Lentisphaerota bacterium]MBT7054087.1 DUF3014 domain-containing protein [Lentisphaerota bacterium]MBT7845126.1 DUF3014 domain-containing protein [Lentisphaerota bacterium]
MDEDRTSVWFWLLPILLLGVAYGVYHAYSRRERVTEVEEIPPLQSAELPLPGPVPPRPSPSPDVVSKEPPAPPAPAEPDILDARDIRGAEALVRTTLTALVSGDGLTEWLAGEELVRRFVTAVDNVAAGRSPRAQVLHTPMAGKFDVVLSGQSLAIAPESFLRYSPVASLFCSFPTAPALALYRRLSPVLQRSYEHIGHPNEAFDDAVIQAGLVLMATPVPEEPIIVTERTHNYAYTDPALEALNDAQKHLLRMGPANVQRVQAKIRGVLLALGVSEPNLP